jgi:hypothetical protein
MPVEVVDASVGSDEGWDVLSWLIFGVTEGWVEG